MTLASLPRHQGGADGLARLLGQALLAGHWHPGETFPRERDLCEHFEVSRNQVRNALAILVALGLIERTAGRGSLVREIGEWHLLDPLVSAWMADIEAPDPQLLREIFAFRYSAEPAVARLAARAAEADDLESLEAAFLSMQRTAGKPEASAQHAECDVAFHDAIYRASHNLVWRQMGHLLRPSIVALIQRSQAHLPPQRDGLEDSLARHGRLLEAIRHRDADAAEAAATDVLQRTAIDLGIVADGQGGPAQATLAEFPVHAKERSQ
ncbi:FadR family transcriptional regulator [Billgrantia diversa]|uniref:FadR/GntR family transcriptional regulator n=1 Tax=Halomonas sp. MCCC 1A13316 TaxID=2733487 RepID=UPI0018A37934|nr:FCD domain-containing protein [Halomonas sp. MCCC 1A13316]QOR39772.1 FadR family transcriptional regulator [Halomonas sp. MCCC 1A13316]